MRGRALLLASVLVAIAEACTPDEKPRVDSQGKRLSWLGSPSKTGITARDVTSTRTEGIAFSGLTQGNYLIEISRAGTEQGTPIRGDLTLLLAGETRRVPFALTGDRVEAGSVRVFFTSRLVPADTPVGFGGWR